MSLIKRENIRVKRPVNGIYVNGHWVDGTPSSFNCAANIQPIPGDEIILLPEANREVEAIVIYSVVTVLKDDLVRRDKDNIAQVNTCTIDNVVDEISYTTMIGGVNISYASGIGATNLTITAGLVAAITIGSSLVTAIDNLDGTYTLTSVVRGDAFTLSVDANQSYVENVTNVLKEFRVIKGEDWEGHLIPHYRNYGYLLENPS